MKISELIEVLQKAKEIHGDLLVTCTCNEIGGTNTITEICIDNNFSIYHTDNKGYIDEEIIKVLSIESDEFKHDKTIVNDNVIKAEEKELEIPF